MLKIAELCVNLHPKLDKTMSMKLIRTLCTLLAAVLIMASCAGSSNETTLYSDAVITAFSLGNLNKYTTTIDDDGDITVTKTTYKGSSYKFIIDQINREIYNNDSLPVGTDAEHILCSISTVNNGVALFKDLTEEDSYYYYYSTDSIDFSTPRTVRVMSSDGQGYTDYTIKVNIHKENGDQFVWNELKSSKEVEQMEGLKALYHNNTIYLFGNLDGKTQIIRIKDDNNWEIIGKATNFSSNAWKNVTTMLGFFFLYDKDVLYVSSDGDTWEPTSYQAEQPIKQLIGASSFELYALSTENKIMVSKDGGESWKVDSNDKPSMIPSEEITIVNYPVYMAERCEQVIMIGNRPAGTNDKYAAVWRKIIDFDDFKDGGSWSYMDLGSMEDYLLPRLTDYNLLCYEDGLLAFGKFPVTDLESKPYLKIYQSRDNGITWKIKEKVYAFPEDMGNKETVTISSVVDKDNNIWLFCTGTGEVWKGRLNSAGWTYQ